MDLKQLLFGQPKASVSMPAQVSGSTEEWLPVADISHGIIALKDGRFIKIIEILPVNFLLKTPAEKASIIYYYASYLKIAPDNLHHKIMRGNVKAAQIVCRDIFQIDFVSGFLQSVAL